MKHARPDYDRIQDPAGLIPEGEPVFLLRGQDRLAPWLVALYGVLVRLSGGDKEIARRSLAQARAMRAWPRRKWPDMPAGLPE